ncbi:MAG: methyltransferase family protein [Candidatus Hodarchaeota archaeon]
MIISYAGLILYAIASIFLIVTRLQIGKYGSGALVIEDNHKLVKTGAYRYIRHPLYSASLLGHLAFGLVFRSLVITVINLSLYFFVFKQRWEQEERILTAEFGEEYTSYMKRTKRIIPFLY